MVSPTKTIQFHYVVLLYSFFCLPFSSSSSDARTAVSGLFCGRRNSSSSDPNYIPTFVEDMQSLSLKLTTRRFATQSINSTMSSSKTKTTSVFALVQCHNDLSPSDCQLCYAIARTRLPRCLPSSSARIFLDGCFLRYETYEFYDESVSATSDKYSCSNDTVSDPQFGFRVSEIAARAAVRHGGFGIAGESGVHALAQCWESVGKEGCKVCLEKAVGEVKRCVSRREGRAMNSGCYLRYSDHKFYNGDAHSIIHGLSNKGVIVAIVLTMSAIVMLVLLATYVIIVKVSKTKQEQRNLALVSKKFKNSKTKFKYETLEKATDYFSHKKKLGQGGNGTVFLGVLPNGKNVAVKRLVWNLYRLNRLVEAVDPCIKEELLQAQGSEAEVCKVLCVGLLCTQASPSLRPSMEEVIRMLTDRDYPIPSPTNPPFLRISSLTTDPESTSILSCSTNSTTTVKTDQASNTSTESSTTHRV
ncbi:unnamed protein product [Thlaspi arvense]|uniref:Gnk2-homologous domain-containing protein n=1 Tax=Thlaspi arvense TaxID=13288 RepID=A0AAU9T564_THLAR|nr:unnamed protein product [Thlaspi arvense]